MLSWHSGSEFTITYTWPSTMPNIRDSGIRLTVPGTPRRPRLVQVRASRAAVSCRRVGCGAPFRPNLRNPPPPPPPLLLLAAAADPADEATLAAADPSCMSVISTSSAAGEGSVEDKAPAAAPEPDAEANAPNSSSSSAPFSSA